MHCPMKKVMCSVCLSVHRRLGVPYGLWSSDPKSFPKGSPWSQLPGPFPGGYPARSIAGRGYVSQDLGDKSGQVTLQAVRLLQFLARLIFIIAGKILRLEFYVNRMSILLFLQVILKRRKNQEEKCSSSENSNTNTKRERDNTFRLRETSM